MINSYLRIVSILIMIYIIITPVSLYAQLSDPGEDPDGIAVPVDGASTILISLGTMYVLRKSRKNIKEHGRIKKKVMSKSGQRIL